MTKDGTADQDLIEAIAKLLNEQNLAEIEIEREDLRVRVTRSYAQSGVQHVMMPAPQHAPALAAAPTAPAGSAAAVRAPADDLASNPGTLTSPMVGTDVPVAGARQAPLRRHRHPRDRGPDHPHHRSDEDDEPDPGA